MLDPIVTGPPWATRRAIARVVELPPAVGRAAGDKPTHRALPVLQEAVLPSHVSVAGDRMWCSRLDATLKAGACVARQKIAAKRMPKYGRKRVTRYDFSGAAAAISMACCRNCADGRIVAERLKVEIPEVARGW